MKEKQIARSYAKTITELGQELNVDVAEELTLLTSMINENNNLETLLFMDVFTIDEKQDVLDQVMSKLKLSPIVVNFMKFLLQQKRVSLFPIIFKDVIVLDDEAKGFMRGTIEGVLDDVDAKFSEKMTKFLSEKIGKDIKLRYEKNKEMTAGYRVTVGDLQLDASLDNQLNKFKETVLNS
jgi:F-type H+-transporting ATPase subunit delta